MRCSSDPVTFKIWRDATAAICISGDSQSVSVAVTVMVFSLLSGLCALFVTPELEW